MTQQSETVNSEANTSFARGLFRAAPGPKGPGVFFLFWGVIYPVVVITIELVTRMCALDLFDPMPSWLHVPVVSFVPVANFFVWNAARQANPDRLKLVAMCNGIAIGVASYYTLMFAPILPIALIALIVGLGLLPLAPLVSLIMAVKGNLYLRKTAPAASIRVGRLTLIGFGLAGIIVIGINAPVTVTRLGMQMATSSDIVSQSRGVKLLRSFGDRELMLRFCYLRGARASDLVSMLVARGGAITPEKAREVYYRVVGHTFNSEAPPRYLSSRGLFAWQGSGDTDQGGTRVGGRVEGLSMLSSRIDGSVDSDAALAYLEWTLEFRNDSAMNREARAQITLPPGGVVSRLTLWIDGQEREAAFAARSQVRQAYERVVRRNRDPVLVTTRGPDQILVQCFPVPPNGGTMKVRAGITAPLVMVAADEAFLKLPMFVERNFSIPELTRHQVWVESNRQLSLPEPSVNSERVKENLFAVRGSMTDAALTGPSAVIKAARLPEVVQAWALDKVSAPAELVIQSIENKKTVPPTKVVIVIDGSASMEGFVPEILKGLKSLPSGIECAVMVASDEPVGIYGHNGKDVRRDQEIEESLRNHHFVGGQDNVETLSQALDKAARRGGASVVWIHGPQPVQLSSAEVLRQRWERRPGEPEVYEVPSRPGPNRITEALDGVSQIHRVPRLGSLDEDLKRLFKSWGSDAREIALTRVRTTPDKTFDPATSKKTSDHLVRLWANDEVLRLRSIRGSESQNQAVRLAAQYQLVTPLTGAVVLETAQQYADAGLTPVPPATVPTIPEPETWLLMAVVLMILLWAVAKRRVRWSAV